MRVKHVDLVKFISGRACMRPVAVIGTACECPIHGGCVIESRSQVLLDQLVLEGLLVWPRFTIGTVVRCCFDAEVLRVASYH